MTFIKFLMSFIKPQFIFPLKFAWIFSMQNSSILFSAQTLYTLVKRSPLKYKFLRFSSARVNIRQTLHVNFETTKQFLFKFFFIVMTRNSSISFKVIDFLLWIKGSQQIPNFETFGCAGKNLSNFSCHFLNHKSVLIQI